MLTLPIKKKWFDMILSGEKKEEYREQKPYYTNRFVNIGLLSPRLKVPTGEVHEVIFRNGYGKNAPEILAKVKLRIRCGFPEWGAEPGIQYYVLEIIEFVDLSKEYDEEQPKCKGIRGADECKRCVFDLWLGCPYREEGDNDVIVNDGGTVCE